MRVADENRRLRAALRDLVALSTIPAAWIGRDPPTIATSLADVLIGSLDLDFAFVRLCDSNGGDPVDVVRGNAWNGFEEFLRHHLAVGTQARRTIVPDVDDNGTRCRGLVIPIGFDGNGGLAAVACHRSDFPTETDQLLLSVAANQAATAYQTARLVYERRSAEEELRIAHDELEMQVTQRTADLQRSEAHLAEAQRLSHMGSWARDGATGEVTHSSDEHARLFGFDPKRDRPSLLEFQRRIHPNDQVRAADVVKNAADQRTDYEVEYRVVRPDGTLRWLLSRGHPVFSASGDLVEFVGTVMDVTERRRSEEALRQAQTELAHATRMTTLGGLAASIAHEIRQPLTAIVADAAASLRWLAESNPKLDMVREALVDVVAGGRRAGVVIDRIRQLAAKNNPQKTPLEINDLIDGVVPLVRLELFKHHVSLRTDLTSALPPVLGDRVQLQQVVINLVMNGVEAMAAVDDRPRELVIRSEADAEDRVVVAVQDAGVGLDPREADRLFTAFFTTKPNGMGMGLAISRSIIETHGGQLWATPNSTHGATFQFSLPAMR